MHYVAPVGEKDEYVKRALDNVRQFLPSEAIEVGATSKRQSH